MDILNSPTFGKVSLEKAVGQIIDYIEKAPKYTYDVVVGSDSQNYNSHTYYVMAIIIHRKGSGGRFYWKKIRKQKEKILRNRMYEEANLSMSLATKLMKYLKRKEALNYNLEIHVDIGPNGKSKQFINEIVGMLKGVGFSVKIKPEAYGATTVADRYT